MNRKFRVIRCLLISIGLACAVGTPALWSQTHEETALWDSIKESKDAEDYKAYLDKYPDGVYAPVAKRRVAQLVAHPSEQTPVAQSGTRADPKSSAPVTMTECEGTNNCATWTFLGGQGNGQWPSGEVANLTVEHSDKDSVVIRRADSTGPSAGLTAVYTGTRHGDRVGGEFTSAWPGHWSNKPGNWYATVEKAQSPPSAMRVCEGNGNITCSTWTWNNGHYDGLWTGIASIPGGVVTATMTVVSFTAESVIINRLDYGASAGYSFVYKGKISPQGDSIVDGVASGMGLNQHFTATWGAALGNIPAAANNQVQPRRQVPVVVCFPWFFGVVCQ